MGREKTFNIRFSDEEWARLDKLSSHYGLTAAALIRMLLKKEEGQVAIETMPDEDELFAEATRRFHRHLDREGAIAVQPSRGQSGFMTRSGRTYFVLRNTKGELARFKVTPSGDLRLLKD